MKFIAFYYFTSACYKFMELFYFIAMFMFANFIYILFLTIWGREKCGKRYKFLQVFTITTSTWVEYLWSNYYPMRNQYYATFLTILTYLKIIYGMYENYKAILFWKQWHIPKHQSSINSAFFPQVTVHWPPH